MSKIFLFFICVLLVQPLYGQDFVKDLSESNSLINIHQGSGDPLNITSYKPGNTQDLSMIESLSKQLITAKDNGNISLMRDLEQQINRLSNDFPQVSNSGADATPIVVDYESSLQMDNIGISRIASGAFWGTATTTQDDNGRIWVAATKYSDTFSDTLRIYYSDNGGVSWSLLAGFQYAATPDLNFRTDDLDIEVLNNGTDWYVYVTGSYTYSGGTYSFVSRYKDDGTGFYYENLPMTTNSSQYWCRVVSDYPRYTNAAYVYIVATMDSNITGGTRKVFSRAFVIQNPYAASPTLLDRNNGAVGSNYWWYTASAPDSSTMKTDVAFYDSAGSGGPKIVTCSIFENHGSIGDFIYMTYSSNFMATTPYITNSIDLTYQSSRPKISFGGDLDQMKGCISTVRRHVNGDDTDPRYIRTSNGGMNWTQGYIDSSVDTTYDADVICLRGIDGHFKIAYTRIDAPNTNPEFLYKSAYSPGSSFNMTAPVIMNGAGIIPDNAFGGSAGYRLTGSDSCFAVYEGPNGSAVYGANGCSGTTVGITNNQIPVKFNLSQNYPNPFNPSTSISYDIPTEGFVKLSIYDMVGREVAVLVNDRKIAGSYRVDFNASGFSSGVYFYKITAGNFTDIKKMMLIK